MKVMILGGDGYLGWPTAMYLSLKGFEVAVIDSMVKRRWEAEVGVEPLTPVPTLRRRIRRWKDVSGKEIPVFIGDIARNHRFIYEAISSFMPDAIVHYAEQPSAPFSMIGRENCVDTQVNNISGTLNVMFAIQHVNPAIHLVKLGTMGEYGTPNIDIEEGWLDVEHNGRRDRVLYPKKPGSYYHLSKVHDSHNLEFACRIWGARVTDLNQGVVYGIASDEILMDPDLLTSFHYDSVFGTVLNRFIVQAVYGLPLTVYGNGSQQRGFLNIRDTLRCVELAIENPAQQGEFRIFNQFTEQFSVLELAEYVKGAAESLGITSQIHNIPNPRIEQENHHFNPKHSALMALGLNPHLLSRKIIQEMIEMVQKNSHRIVPETVMPEVQWKQG